MPLSRETFIDGHKVSEYYKRDGQLEELTVYVDGRRVLQQSYDQACDRIRKERNEAIKKELGL